MGDLKLHFLDKVMQQLGKDTEDQFMFFTSEVFQGELLTVVNLVTFPDSSKDWCREFSIPAYSFFKLLRELFDIKEPEKVANFLEKYDWGQTYDVYNAASDDGLIVSTKVF